jgi:hypothetical protein
VQTTEVPARFSRKWFGEIWSGCFALLVALRIVRDVVDWDSRGVAFWLLWAPLFAGYVLAGVPWLVLAVRDGFRNRRAVWAEARVWLTFLGVVTAIASAILAVMWAAGSV